ncbi:DUF4239 domain-containing protein [Isoptericola sediminis]|uniref:DUF4239 domain-containing protein n=1 Tax=Isoptericola sediminis TaxID=2733572 RepID=A0A849JUH8_9MICO|nr:DUF4239 domain-containing protein [Isoptericola sediminis]NNU26962.1 DUF4239 domain-containing protein [Isoptericola sediminis]
MSWGPGVSAVIIVLVGLVAGTITIVVRRTAPRLGSVDPAPWSATLSYVATAYGIVIGFSILYLFGAYAGARSAVGDEATSIGTAFEEVQLFDEAAPDVQHALICYARAASAYDWPAMQEGTSAPEVDDAYADLVASLGQAQEPPQGTFGPATATNVLVQIGSISTARETRLVAATTVLPVLLWALVLGGGLLVVALIFAVTLPAARRTQSVLVGLAASFTTVLVLLVAALNSPFSAGSGRVSPALIDQTTVSMEQSAPEIAGRPCPASGG